LTIWEITEKYRKKIDYLDLEIILAHSLGKTKEFILTYPEYKLTKFQISNFKFQINRRIKMEPLAYILGHKEFYGLDFMVNKYTLIPRPETEMMVEEVIHETCDMKHVAQDAYIIDIGTGSGCIITAIANALENDTRYKIQDTRFIATDISQDALKIAKKNAKKHGLEKKIKFIHGSLLDPIINKAKKLTPGKLIIMANLPYLSKEIYSSAASNVKKFEPKSALYSAEAGLAHYRKLLEQIKTLLVSCSMLNISCYMEISPEQKSPLAKLVKSILPTAKIEFKKDLARKWRICKITL